MFIGEIGNLPGTRGGDASFDGRVRFLTRLDTLEEIPHVVDRSVAEAFFLQDRILATLHALPVNAETAAINLQCRLGAAEFEAAVVNGGAHHAFVHYIPPWVAQRRLNGVGAIPFVEDIFVGQHLRLARGIRLHRPVRYVDPVGKQVSHAATAEIPVPTPEVEFLQAEGLVGSGSEPKLPVQGLGVDRLGPPAGFVIVLPPIGSNLGDSAQTTRLNKIDGITKVSPAALLHPTLQDLLAATHRMGEGGAFFDRVGDGLFQVNVFAGSHCVARDAHVPVVRNSDENRVHVLGQHFVIVDMGGSSSTGGPRLHLITAWPIDVAHSHNFVGDAGAVGRIEQGCHPLPGSYDPNVKSVVCSEDFGGSKGGQSACYKEAAAIRHIRHNAPANLFATPILSVKLTLRACSVNKYQQHLAQRPR